MENRILDIVFIIIVAILVAVFLKWNNTSTMMQPPIKNLTKIKSELRSKYKTFNSVKIRYIPKNVYVKRLKTPLNTTLKKDNIKILTTGKVPAYKGKTMVTAFLDTKTGQGSLYFNELPYSKTWLSFDSVKTLSFSYGYISSKVGTRQGLLMGFNYGFMQIKGFSFSVNDTLFINQEPINFIGLKIKYNF